MRRLIFATLIIFLLTLSAAAVPTQKVQADSGVTAYDLIAMVNSIRTSTFGLPALVENSILDQATQWTADEMVRINADDHLYYLGYAGASARAANQFGFGGGKTVFVTENWCRGYNATLSYIQNCWNDEEHLWPMDKPEYTYVGAGTATTSDGHVYYVLQAGYMSGENAATSAVIGGSMPPAGSGTTTSVAADLSDWVAAVYTSTPSPDGMIYHKVQANQMLSNIALAYGVSVDYLVQLNNLTSADAIYAGQILTIKSAPTATVTPTLTPTEIYPTHTPTLELTATPYLTRTPTPKPTLLEQLPKWDRQTFGLLLVILSLPTLLLVIFKSFLNPHQAVKKGVTEKPEIVPEKKPESKGVKTTTPVQPVKKPALTKDHKPLDIPVKTSRRTTKK
jgi:LysM repeat protein